MRAIYANFIRNLGMFVKAFLWYSSLLTAFAQATAIFFRKNTLKLQFELQSRWDLRFARNISTLTFICNLQILTIFLAKTILCIIRIVNAFQTFFTGLYSLSTWARGWTLLTDCAWALFNTVRKGRFTLLAFFQGKSLIWQFEVYIWIG